MILLIFGDSIGCGCWDEKGGWADRLRKIIYRKAIATSLDNASAIYNLSIDGDTSEWLLPRLETDIKKTRARTSLEVAIIFAIGVNDSQFLNEKKEFLVPPDEFRANLQRLVGIAKKHTSKIIFLGLTPVDDSKVDPCPWVPERSYRNENVKKYNQIIKEECSKNKVDFFEIFEKFSQADNKKLLIDGVHPNTQGHELIFEIVKDYLIKKKII